MRQSITDKAIVLSRVDYGEKDRILTLITPNHGKLRAIAKSVRSAKSRLAGGIELFAENELGLAQGRGELYTVTFSRMKRYFGKISKDTEATMYAYECLKAVNKLTPDNAGGEYYDSLAKLLETLDSAEIPLAQIKIWYGLKQLESLGASPNLTSNQTGTELDGSGSFQYDFDKHCFYEKTGGPYSANHIKILRHLGKTSKPVEIKGLDDKLADSTESLISTLVRDHHN